MASRFDIPTPQQYVSQYAPLPLSEISALARDYSDKYHKAEEAAYGLNDLANHINAIDEHQPAKQALLNYYTPKINELTDKIAKGTDLLTAKRDLNKLQREFVNDPTRIELEKSVAEKALAQKKMIDLGSKYQKYNDPNANFTGFTTDGKLNPYRFNGMNEAQDHVKRATDMMSGIASDGYDAKNEVWDPNSGIIVDRHSGRESLTSQKVRGVANQNVENFLRTPEGEDFIRKEKYSNPNLDSQTLYKNASDLLYDTAVKQIFSKTKSGIGYNFDPTFKDKQDQAVANLTTSSQSEAISNNTEDMATIKGMQFDSKGNLKIPDQTGFVDTGTSKGSTGTMGTSGLTNAKGKDLNKMAEQVAYIKSLQDTHPNLRGLTPQATVEAIKKAHKSVSSESIPLESISNVAAKNIGDAISRNKSQRNFYLADSKGRTDDGTLKTVLDKLDINEEDFDKALKDGIGGYTQAGPSAGGYYVEVKDNDGNSRRVIISPDKEMQTIFRTSQAVNEARKTLNPGLVTPFPENPNYKIAIKPEINKDGSTNWSYTEIITDANGNIKVSSPTTLEEIRKAERQHLQKSGYLGSNLGVLKSNTTE